MLGDHTSYRSVPSDTDTIDANELLEPMQPDKWHSIGNLDVFFTRVFDYFQGKGFWTILLARSLSLLIFAFILCLAVFILGYLDFSLVFVVKDLEAAVRPRAIDTLNPFLVLCVVIFAVYWVWEFLRLLFHIRGLWEMRQFYNRKLEIDERTLQTVQWSEVVDRLIAVHNREKLVVVKEQLKPDDIVSRIMRKDNYLIAMFNKVRVSVSEVTCQDLLAISLWIPFFGVTKILTRTLEWNLSYCVLGYMFDKDHNVRREFLDAQQGPRLASGLKRRFIFMGILNLVLAPFMVVMLIVWFFLRYTEEFNRDPGNIGTRTFTSLARWRFREFNELQNVFEKRLNASRQHALKYVLMFPSSSTAVLARFVSFVVGAFAAVLTALSFFDANIIMNLHIGGKAVVWFLGIFGAILAVTRSLIPSDSASFEPESVLRQVAHHTHYLPTHWRGKAHTPDVYDEFQGLLTFRVLVFLHELVSVLLTPLVLLFSMPRCAEQIVSFVRQCTVEVEGVGYVCLFSTFDFKNHGDPSFGSRPRDGPRMTASDGKMEKSFISFRAAYPSWRPDANSGGAELLEELSVFHASASQTLHRAFEIGDEEVELPTRAAASIQADERTRAASDGAVAQDVREVLPAALTHTQPGMSLLIPSTSLFVREPSGDLGLRMPRQFYIDLLDAYYNAHIPHGQHEGPTDAVDVPDGFGV